MGETPELAKRVGLAIERKLEELSGGDYSMNYVAGSGALGYEELALVAIEAMREPTEAMEIAGFNAPRAAKWQAMIDAALTPPNPEPEDMK